MAWPIDFLHKVQLESVLSELKDTKVKGTKFTKCVLNVSSLIVY